MILLAEHDEPSLAAKKKQQQSSLKKATSTPKNRVWNFFNSPSGRISNEPDLSAETATGSVQYSYETASGRGYYYSRDHLGSIHELVDGSGNLLSRYIYDPNGVTTITHTAANTSTPPIDATFLWDGMYYHVSSEQYQTWHRIYDPLTGRWKSEDPIGERGGFNLYAFADQDPIERTDLLGLCSLGDYQEDSLKVVVTNAGETPTEKNWLNKALTVGTYLGGPEVSAVASSASKSQKAAVAIEQLYASTGYTFNIWVQLKYSCCVCGKGGNQWQKQSPLQNKVTASGNSDPADPAPDYMVNFPDVGKYIGADVQAAIDSLRNQAKQNCKQYAPKEDPNGDSTPLQP